MKAHNLRDLAKYTVISFCATNPYLCHAITTSDIYNVSLIENPIKSGSTDQIANLLPEFTAKSVEALWVKSKAPLNAQDEIDSAFSKVGINQSLGKVLVDMAKGILAESNYVDLKISPAITFNPEEVSKHLTLRIYIKAGFEESLAVDTYLTSELINRMNSLPENVSVAVYELE